MSLDLQASLSSNSIDSLCFWVAQVPRSLWHNKYFTPLHGTMCMKAVDWILNAKSFDYKLQIFMQENRRKKNAQWIILYVTTPLLLKHTCSWSQKTFHSKSSGIICRSPPPSSLPSKLLTDKQHSNGFFSTQKVYYMVIYRFNMTSSSLIVAHSFFASYLCMV